MAEIEGTRLSSDAVFNLINKRFITLNDEDVKRNNVYLKQVIQMIMECMKSRDQLFAKVFKEIKFCGSFYKGTKVGKPNEYDLNIILKFPVKYEFHSPRPGFLQIIVKDKTHNKTCYRNYYSQIDNYKKSEGLSDAEIKTINSWITSDYLDPNKFRSWIEGITTKVVNELPASGYKHITKVIKIKIVKSGPAFTVKLNIPNEPEEISVDLVPVLAFNIDVARPFVHNFDVLQRCKPNPWFAVPIVTGDTSSGIKPAYSWRFAFSPQEKYILTKHGRLKPLIRQMKKLRDTQNWPCLKSYFIETLFLNKLPEIERDLNNTSFTYLLFKMLKAVQRACEQGRIHYYWNPNFNLLEGISSIQIDNVANRANRIVKDIERNIMKEPFILAKYILTTDELRILRMESVQLGDRYPYNEDEPDTANILRCIIL